MSIDEKLLANGGARPADFRPVRGVSGQIWSFARLGDRLYACHNLGISEIRPDLAIIPLSDMGGYRLRQVRLGNKQYTFFASYYKLRGFDGKNTWEIDGLDDAVSGIEADYMQNLWLEHPSKGVYRCRLDDEGRRITAHSAYGGGTGDGLPYRLRQFRAGGRVAFVGDDRFFRYNEYTDRIEPDPILDSAFHGIRGIRRVIAKDEGEFWVLTELGVWLLRYDGSRNVSLSPCAGIPVGNLIYGYEQIARLDDSTSLFCGDNGFELVSPDKVVQSPPLPAPPVLEAIGSVDRRGNTLWHPTSASVRIPFTENSVTLRYSPSEGMTFGIRFRHRLSGIDDAWSEPDRQGKTDYARLPQGRYRFEVAVCDTFGRWSAPASFEFEVLSPWYLSSWAYTGYLLAAIGLFYGSWMLVMSIYRKRYLRHLRLQEIVSLRRANRELRQKAEQCEAEVMAQSSALLGRDEMILHMRNLVNDFQSRHGNGNSALLQQKINAYVSSRLDTENDWTLFLIKFEQKHANYFRTMKERFPELTTSDLRLSACLKMNLCTKEIAALMNLSVRAVENGRYRLRKKLGLTSEQNLNEFLLHIDEPTADADFREA